MAIRWTSEDVDGGCKYYIQTEVLGNERGEVERAAKSLPRSDLYRPVLAAAGVATPTNSREGRQVQEKADSIEYSSTPLTADEIRDRYNEAVREEPEEKGRPIRILHEITIPDSL
jgi:hypothetical protein